MLLVVRLYGTTTGLRFEKRAIGESVDAEAENFGSLSAVHGKSIAMKLAVEKRRSHKENAVATLTLHSAQRPDHVKKVMAVTLHLWYNWGDKVSLD